MSWNDVPEKLARYNAEEYAPPNAAATLLANYRATNLNEVPVKLREEFELDLDYRLGACINLRNSRAIDPKRLQ